MFKVSENEMLLRTIKHKPSVEEKEINIAIIESNRTDNDFLQNMMMMMMMMMMILI